MYTESYLQSSFANQLTSKNKLSIYIAHMSKIMFFSKNVRSTKTENATNFQNLNSNTRHQAPQSDIAPPDKVIIQVGSMRVSLPPFSHPLKIRGEAITLFSLFERSGALQSSLFSQSFALFFGKQEVLLGDEVGAGEPNDFAI